jgi:hypothetical protein
MNPDIIQLGIIHQMLIEHMAALASIMEILVLILVLVAAEETGKKVLVVVHLLIRMADQAVVEIIMLMVETMVVEEEAEAKHFSGDHGIILHHLGDQEPVEVEELSD